jgi:hypothetical protein
MADPCMQVTASILPRFSPPLSPSPTTRLASARDPPCTMTHLAAALVRSLSLAPLFPTLGGHPNIWAGDNDNLSSPGLTMDLSLHHLVQLLHSKAGWIHLQQENSTALSAQPAVTTSVNAHGVPIVLAVYGRESIPKPARHYSRT